MNVLIGTDHVIYYEALRRVFQHLEPNAEVTMADNLLSCRQLLKAHRYTFTFIDRAIRGSYDSGFFQLIKEYGSSTHLIIGLTDTPPGNSLGLPLKGVRSTIHRSCSSRELLEILTAIQADSPATCSPTIPIKNPLTERQTEIIKRVVDGCTNKQIATQLSIAEGTVRNQMVNIMRKLEVRNRTAAARKAIKFIEC